MKLSVVFGFFCGGIKFIMNICICDDEINERKIIREICEEYFRKRELTYQICEAENGLEVLEYKERIDLLILDIEMPGMDGVTLKDHLQRADNRTKVIFVTSHEEMMPEAFGMYVIGFIGKEWLSVKLSRYLSLAVTLNGKDILIDKKYHSKNVMKIHSEREYCNLYFEDGTTVLVRSSLRDMGRLLREADFVQVSRSWIVNLYFVDRYNKKEIIVQGEGISVGRSFREKLDRMYEDFCERNARYC